MKTCCNVKLINHFVSYSTTHFKYSTVFIIVRSMMGVVKKNVVKEVPVM